MLGFIIGAYVTGFIFTFFVAGILFCLGGNEREFWKPFAAALFWPIVVLFILLEKQYD